MFSLLADLVNFIQEHPVLGTVVYLVIAMILYSVLCTLDRYLTLGEISRIALLWLPISLLLVMMIPVNMAWAVLELPWTAFNVIKNDIVPTIRQLYNKLKVNEGTR